MRTEQDARNVPIAGDKVGDRWVVKITRNDIHYRKQTANGGWGVVRMCFITTWQTWAKDKEVKHVAE